MNIFVFAVVVMSLGLVAIMIADLIAFYIKTERPPIYKNPPFIFQEPTVKGVDASRITLYRTGRVNKNVLATYFSDLNYIWLSSKWIRRSKLSSELICQLISHETLHMVLTQYGMIEESKALDNCKTSSIDYSGLGKFGNNKGLMVFVVTENEDVIDVTEGEKENGK